VAEVEPDVIVICNWAIAPNLAQQEATRVPVVLDQHGPHLLEQEYQRLGTRDANTRVKLAALAAADYFACAGLRQLDYFEWFLRNAAWSEADLAARVFAIPFSLDPESPMHEPVGAVTFVYGGVWLPWQDPSTGLLTLVDELEARGSGTLRLYGGKHPWIDVGSGVFELLTARLQQSARVVQEGRLSHADLLARYATAHVAFDLMERNPERELAFTSRTVEYLWCGLPVVYNDYSELSELIREFDAGWTVSPGDADAIRGVVAEILDDPGLVDLKSRNAQRLVRERLAWDRTIEPLDGALRKLALRSGAVPFSLADVSARRTGSVLERALRAYRRGGLSELARRAARR
jgi:glycosyltransferase involved in cell wall biosynthesis